MPIGSRRFLVFAWALTICLSAIMAISVTRLAFNDGLSTAFESDTETFRAFQNFSERFNSDGAEILVLFHTDDFAHPQKNTAVETFITEAQFIENVSAVLSPFSFQYTSPEGVEDFLFPYQRPAQSEMAQRLSHAQAQNPRLGTLISPDRQHLLVVISLTSYPETGPDQQVLLAQLNELATASTADLGINAALSGYPVLRTETVRLLFQEFIWLNVFGAVMGLTLAVLTLGNLGLGIITTLSSGLALLWAAGAMVFLGFQINVITVALPALILILSFAEAIHLVLEIRQQIADGRANPIHRAVRRIFPAAGLAAITTGIALGSLMLSPSALIYQLGFAGLFATLISTITIFTIVPLVFLTLGYFNRLSWVNTDAGLRMQRRFGLGGLIKIAQVAPVKTCASGLVIFATSLCIYAQLPYSYSLYEGLKPNAEPVATLRTIETQLSPIGTIKFEHPIEPIDQLKQATIALRGEFGAQNILGLYDVIEDDPLNWRQTLAALPLPLSQQLISHDATSTVITLVHPYQNSGATAAYLGEITPRIASMPQLAALGPPTGALVLSSLTSREMLSAFARCFLFAVLISGVLISWWLRNAIIGICVMIPNVLPITVVGSVMVFLDYGLSFSSGVALTIAFGIAIDDTVHVLNRLRIQAKETPHMAPHMILNAVRQTAPALMISSLILVMGLLGNFVSEMPPLAIFGGLSIGVFIMALLSDVLFLPALLICLTQILPAKFLRIGK
ncbi:hypothetical protein GCM10007939_02210 [Amylibacter marinus]|uniref:SSD domain-containing protein n=1 Tax=Amylibacter marinus TaxID=1475483 RepID=A0ABQ5VR95_9RHOB|nr:MMPL family transporter [Amylibacter marinus]GLQ33938.1 hypothetical protein GCM10007939_02210 [Amylibacter marinus]